MNEARRLADQAMLLYNRLWSRSQCVQPGSDAHTRIAIVMQRAGRRCARRNAAAVQAAFAATVRGDVP